MRKNSTEQCATFCATGWRLHMMWRSVFVAYEAINKSFTIIDMLTMQLGFIFILMKIFCFRCLFRFILYIYIYYFVLLYFCRTTILCGEMGIFRVSSCFPFTTNSMWWNVLEWKMCYSGNYLVIFVRGASIRLVLIWIWIVSDRSMVSVLWSKQEFRTFQLYFLDCFYWECISYVYKRLWSVSQP